MDITIPPEQLIDGRTVLFTFTTLGFAPFVLNLHQSLIRSDRELADKLVVFCADDATVDLLAAAGIFAVNCETTGLPEFAEFEGSGFGRVVSYKYLLARRLLEQVEQVWWVDGDIVAQAPMAGRVLSLMDRSNCDLLMQAEWPKDVFNTGFWVARRSAPVMEMLAEMVDYTTREDADDQAYFNETQVGPGRLHITGLAHDEFMCGNRFFFTRLFGRPDALMLHFNYSVGRDTKKTLLIGHGCWYLGEPRSVVRRARLRHVAMVLMTRRGVSYPERKIDWVEARIGRLLDTMRRGEKPAP